MKLRTACALVALSLGVGAVPARVLAWDWFRSENDDVLKGNEQLAKGQLDKAIAAYSDAAKRLPQEGGVHLDRGIALLKSGKLTEARDALLIATQGKASAEVRAKAHYNLGLAFLQEADAAAKAEDLEQAQKLLREATDAFKSSLREGPKNRDAAWNFELAKRRMVELEKKQQEKKDQEKKEQEQKDQEKKNQDDSQKSDDKNDQDDSQKSDGQKDSDSKKDGQKDSGEPDAGQPPEPKPGADAGAPEQPKSEKHDKPEESPSQADKPQPALPEHMQKALDALGDSEENLQKHQAAMRARQQPRRIEKDW